MSDLPNRKWVPDQPLTEWQQQCVITALQVQPRALLLSWLNDPDHVRRAAARAAAELDREAQP